MIPGNRSSRFFRPTVEHLKTILSTVSWSIIGGGILFLPAVFVCVFPYLISSQSPSLMKRSEPLAQAGMTHDSRVSPKYPLQDETEIPISRGRQISPHTPFQPRPNQSQDEIHLLVDTSRHRLFVKQGDRILLTAIASTGRGNILADPQNPDRIWTFDTPKGLFRIQSKLEKPVWVRPDWAFIEKGDPIPENMRERLMPGVLGQYALGFGDGYFIHGALYSNLLGQDVTHGCIQVGRKDLEYVFRTVPLGAPLIIL